MKGRNLGFCERYNISEPINRKNIVIGLFKGNGRGMTIGRGFSRSKSIIPNRTILNKLFLFIRNNEILE